MDATPHERIRRARETREVLRRVHPAAHPDFDDIAALHELHAEHERSEGRFDRADEASRRAERARALQPRRAENVLGR
jgi:hypothetical protein